MSESREIHRKRLVGLKAYYAQPRHGLPARPQQVDALSRQLDAYPIGGILPEEPRNLLAHCGQWHAVTTLPQRLACCGYVVGDTP